MHPLLHLYPHVVSLLAAPFMAVEEEEETVCTVVVGFFCFVAAAAVVTRRRNFRFKATGARSFW